MQLNGKAVDVTRVETAEGAFYDVLVRCPAFFVPNSEATTYPATVVVPAEMLRNALNRTEQEKP